MALAYYGLAPHIDNDAFTLQTKGRLETLRSEFAGNTLRGGKLKDQVCVVTGVGSLRGIGRATAILYAHEGAKHLYLLDFDGTNLPELKQTIEKSYPDVKVSTLQADASDDAAIKGLCESALQEEGRLDVFFANAGVAAYHHLNEISQDSFMNVVKINTLSCFLALKYASVAMSQVNASCGKEYAGGSIIMTASVAGIRSGGGPVDYSASKAAINSLAQTGAYQLQRTGIRVNTICPGLIETNMTTGVFERVEANNEIKSGFGLIAMGRQAIPEEIAKVALFLACDDSSYVNGQNIAVDGGLSATLPIRPGYWA